jgi:hypothetical protein
MKSRAKLAMDLRDQIEVVQSTDYPRFLQSLMNVFQDILITVPTSFNEEKDEQVFELDN